MSNIFYIGRAEKSGLQGFAKQHKGTKTRHVNNGDSSWQVIVVSIIQIK